MPLDLHILHMAEWPQMPMTMGHEGAGQIAKLGSGVTGWDVGDNVLLYLCWGVDAVAHARPGTKNYCEVYKREIVPGPGLGFDGSMAEYVVAQARFLVPLGDLDPVDAAPLTDAALTPYHAVNIARSHLAPTSRAVRHRCGWTRTHGRADPDRGHRRAGHRRGPGTSRGLDHAKQLGAEHTVVSGPDTAAEIWT